MTDLPLRVDGRLVVADASLADRVAVISLPALGATRQRHDLKYAIACIIDELVADDQIDPERDDPADAKCPGGRFGR